MSEFNHLILPCKHDGVIADYGAAPNRRNTDFLRVSLFVAVMTAEYEVIFIAESFVHAFAERQGRSARSIDLSVVVRFHDLHIVTRGSQKSSSLLYKLHQQIDADRHIRGAEDRDDFAAFGHLREGLLRESGGAENQGKSVVYTEIQKGICRPEI